MLSKTKILIVDDEPLNVKLLAASLSTDRYQITTAFNGKQALERVIEDFPDLILLDIMMPGIDGFEVTRRLKTNPSTRDIPVILITASDSADFKVIGLEAGADEFLNKPVNAIELNSRVKSLIHTKKYRDELSRKQAINDESSYNNEKNQNVGHIESSVLLVSENEDDAKLIRMFLQDQLYQIISIISAKEMLEFFNKKNIDLVIFDVMQDGVEGFETCCRLKEKEQTANTQFLIISDSDYLERHHEQFEHWTDDFLIKPININELRLRVSALLKKKIYLDRLYSGTEGSVTAAITDKLSGLANYSYFKLFLEHEIKRYKRDGRPVALIMMELTDEKHNPNCLGHLAGELLLNDLGTIIKENIRDIDLGARYTENQFAIVLANTNSSGAKIVAERLKGLIQNYLIKRAENKSGKGSLNYAIANYPKDGHSIDLLISKAEKWLSK